MHRRTDALRALRDCGVIRAKRDHPGFKELWTDFLADIHPAPGSDDYWDYRLTESGKSEAAKIART